MVYMGAIANGGESIQPRLLKSSTFLNIGSSGKSLGEYLSSSTAKKLKSMMKNNVKTTYGEYNYSGLDIYAKSGTAETGSGEDSWFVGFIDNDNYPLAFVVWVKDGGTGYATGGPIANAVLNKIISDGDGDTDSE
jgi:penicillin-binding protein A